MSKQNCPNCLRRVDVGIYVSGRRIRCPFCHIPFVVTRDEAGGGPEAPIRAHPEFTIEAETTPSRPVRALKSDGSPLGDDDDVAAAAPQMSLPPDAPEIPGYQLTAVVGQGAMGTVFKATRASDGSVVALKMLAEKLQTSQEFVARFEREVAAIAVVDHPYVVRLIDHGALGERRWFAMEFVEGTSLRAEFAVTRPVPSRVVAILHAVTEGCIAAHDAGVVHRDLKPENVVVTPDGGVRIVDYGLAGLFGDGDPHPNLTRSRVTMGTINYMAPEQRTNAKYVDHRADIYALGVMLYEGLTGDLPVGRFQYPSERGLALPKFVDAILIRSLAKDPKDRYETTRDLLADLKKLARVLDSTALADTALPKRPPAVLREQVNSRRRSLRETVFEPGARRWAVVGMIILVLAVVAFLLAWWGGGEPPAGAAG